MLQLPNLDETKDPVIKKLIIAVQELADQVGTRDTMIFHDIHEEIKGLRTEVRTGFKETTQRLGSLEKEMKQTREETVDLLKQIAKNTEK